MIQVQSKWAMFVNNWLLCVRAQRFQHATPRRRRTELPKKCVTFYVARKGKGEKVRYWHTSLFAFRPNKNTRMAIFNSGPSTLTRRVRMYTSTCTESRFGCTNIGGRNSSWFWMFHMDIWLNNAYLMYGRKLIPASDQTLILTTPFDYVVADPTLRKFWYFNFLIFSSHINL